MSSQMSIFDLGAGVRGLDAGIESVISNNECFVATMRGCARIIARRKGAVSCDDLRQLAGEYGIQPNHENAWGGIFRGGEWVPVGRIKSKVPSNQAREIKTWALRSGV